MPYLAGRNPVIEALKSGSDIRKLYVQESAHGGPVELIRRLAAEKGIRVITLSKEELLALLPGERAQGVIAEIAERRLFRLEEVLTAPGNTPGFILLPDQIEDPRNLGALLRTAECAGVHAVVLMKHHAASLSPAAVKSSAGATEHLAIAEASNLVQTIRTLKENGYWIVGLDAAAPTLYTELEYTMPVAVVVGNEAKGIRRLVREHCDYLARIPLAGKIESLNASVAGALLMFEVRRQRDRQP